MSILPCLSWVPFLWGQVYQIFAQNRTTEKALPTDIIVDIFSRLPAECVVLCGHASKLLHPLTTTPSFVDMHLNRATPIIAFHYYSISALLDRKVICEVSINFTDEEGERFVTKRINIDLCFTSPKKYSMPLFYGSYHGFLLFRNVHDSVLFIWNPITQEELIIAASNPDYTVRGFFFHPTFREYRAVFINPKEVCFESAVYSLGTKSLRQIANFSHPPTFYRNPTILNGSLHWMVDDLYYKSACGVFPDCSNSIVVFNMESEAFCTMSHPGVECPSKGEHYMMTLLEMEGHLCYCDDLCEEIVIWILEDYKKQVWVKRHVVIITPMKKSCIARYGLTRMVQAIHIYGNELLLSLFSGNLFLYNLHLGTFRRVGKSCVDSDSVVSAIAHTNSLVSLRGDSMPKL